MTFWKRQNWGEKVDQWLPGAEFAYSGMGMVLEGDQTILYFAYNGGFRAVCVCHHS